MPRLPYTLHNASTALIRLNYDCRKGLWRPTPAFTAQEVVGWPEREGDFPETIQLGHCRNWALSLAQCPSLLLPASDLLLVLSATLHPCLLLLPFLSGSGLDAFFAISKCAQEPSIHFN